ncbi:beta-N-acetylhexosaminidase [Rhodospirillum centenum]|uniref:beta-N-acetylhexosaminidase n=1 Tax=Rhodospirillum centenum (strain ATCC 51521 / SW) TaxID=414684 RepID=B6ISL4_RHOCS|nr:beta-N-acetylhexosaminidase [Rhodospirillum centenum]ACI98450.1 beta-glucosidase-like protein [Rhodospirillum centenum SW]
MSAASSSSEPPRRPLAVAFGCAGPDLTAQERAFFREADPFGFILFRRNAETPEQVRRLTGDLRDAVGRDAPVLIDQEGGRVARLRPPHWPEFPAARRIGDLAERDPEAGARAAWLDGRLLAHMLADVGIDVDCAPVADLPVPGSHDVIGDRAFGADPGLVARLARAQAEGLLAGGVLPVVKHLPGHGRASADSHRELPVVTAERAVLEATDFAPFRALSDLPCGMAAHVVYTAVDPAMPASTSAAVIRTVIRGWIGFQGLLFSDDLSMQALSGGPGERARAVLAGGCDVALHCNGVLAEMLEIAAAAPHLSEAGAVRWGRAAALRDAVEPADAGALRREFDALLAARIA